VRRGLITWLTATRYWSFPASVLPVLTVTAWCFWSHGGGDLVNAALSAVVMVCLHAAANVLSDCRDFESGVDGKNSPNGVTWIHDGTFRVSELLKLAVMLAGTGVAIGLVVAVRGGWPLMGIGAAGLVIALGYSFLKFHALGDVAVFLSFALLPALGVGFAVTGVWLSQTVIVAAVPGLLTMSILQANNMRDVVSDGQSGCRTVPSLIGRSAAVALYVAEVVLPFAIVVAAMFWGIFPYASVAVFLALPQVVRVVKRVRYGDGRGLADLDRESAFLQLMFGGLFAASFAVGRLNFWLQLSLASVLLLTLVVRQGGLVNFRGVCWGREIPLGCVLALSLWLVFWVGDVASRVAFPFAGAQIDAVYALGSGMPKPLVALLLLALIGPAEELFWRGLVQRRLAECWGPNTAMLMTAFAYAAVHVWSLNFMLIGAACVCGLFWGGFYRLWPRHLPALVISHALWDVLAFVLFVFPR